MTVEDFQQAFKKEISEVATRIRQPYSVGEAELAAALHASAKKYLGAQIEETTGNPGPTAAARQQVFVLLRSRLAARLAAGGGLSTLRRPAPADQPIGADRRA